MNVTLPQLRRETKPLRRGDDREKEKEEEAWIVCWKQREKGKGMKWLW